MAPVTNLLLPMALLTLLPDVVAGQLLPTAIKKQTPGSNEKLLAEHLAFAPLPGHELTPLATGPQWNDDFAIELETHPRRHARAFAAHHRESKANILQRAAEALALLEKRTSCPAGMSGCDNIGSPNKCCPSGTYCTSVPDVNVGQVACCPNGAICGGGVGTCPNGAASCAPDLGGGCCIPGFVCQGYGCVPRASATVTGSGIVSATAPPTAQTITTTKTTIVAGNPSTVVVTLTITRTTVPAPVTQTETKVVDAPTPSTTLSQALSSGPSPSHSSAASSGPSTATGVPPWRPTAISSSHRTSTAPEHTQTGCPTGFYGCLATHGGGCCRTERDCGVLSCPAPSSTVVSHGVTIVVPASDVPALATSSCAGGWFLCGKDAGPVAGCCPSGYECGVASCFTTQASSTSKVQKEAPSKNAAALGLRLQPLGSLCILGSALLALLI